MLISSSSSADLFSGRQFMYSITVYSVNTIDFHARPACKSVRCAHRYNSVVVRYLLSCLT